jgi:hypothetical protein
LLEVIFTLVAGILGVFPGVDAGAVFVTELDEFVEFDELPRLGVLVGRTVTAVFVAFALVLN